MNARIPALLIVLAAAAPALAQDYRHGRISHVEGGTTLQRASETGAEEALRNLPFLPGDRVWTTADGRAEFQFVGGVLLRLDSRSKLDYIAHEGERDDERLALRLWSGSTILRLSSRAPIVEIETPGGLVTARSRSALRLDVRSGEARLAVLEGRADLDTGRRRVRLEAGEQTFASQGEVDEPRELDLRGDDDFASWEQDREAQVGVADDPPRYLPEELAEYEPELDRNGSWHVEIGVGNVWVPNAGSGWQPYLNGGWRWTPYGWTFVPNESWAWAPSHYGRWGHSVNLGWYWMPDNVWGPAWVSWSAGGDYVGWCPLGRGDRPATYRPRDRGHAVPRGSAAERAAGAGAWTYARRGDLGARNVATRRVALSEIAARELRPITPRVERLGRDAHVGPARSGTGEYAGARAVPRNIQTRPTPGDTVPELRTDPATTIPFPVARRKKPADEERRQGNDRQTQQTRRSRFSESAAPQERGGAVSAQPRGADQETESEDQGSWSRRRVVPVTPPAERTSEEGARKRQREDAERDDTRRDNEVLRRVFRPLSEGQSRGGERQRDDSASTERQRQRDSNAERDRQTERRRPEAGSPWSRPRSDPRSKPPQAERQRSQPKGERSGGAVRREKEKH
ncbi:MAG: DUF6600 domain-containing protein [Vicinamibacteria bacterium]